MGRQLIALTLILLSTPAWAKGKEKSGGKDVGMAWFGVGLGTTTVFSPEDKVDTGTLLFGEAGGEFQLFGPVFFAFGIPGRISYGKMEYDFTGTDNIHYTAPDIDFSLISSGLRGGLKIRLINKANFHVYVDGGVWYTTGTITYSTTNKPALLAQGTTYQTTQKDVMDYGHYGEAGVEFLLWKFGLRLAARADSGQTDKIKALANRSMKHKDAYGIIAFIKEL